MCYLSLVPSPPTNLLIRDVQSRRFQITFSAPYNINGEMVGYKIRLLHHQDCLQLIIVSNNCFQCMVKNTIIQLLLWFFFRSLLFSYQKSTIFTMPKGEVNIVLRGKPNRPVDRLVWILYLDGSQFVVVIENNLATIVLLYDLTTNR